MWCQGLPRQPRGGAFRLGRFGRGSRGVGERPGEVHVRLQLAIHAGGRSAGIPHQGVELEDGYGQLPVLGRQEVDKTERFQGLQGVPQSWARQVGKQQRVRHRAGTKEQLIGDGCVCEAGQQPQQRARLPHPLAIQHVKRDLPGPADQVPSVLFGDLSLSGICDPASREGNVDPVRLSSA